MNKEISIVIQYVINQDFELIKSKILDINYFNKWWKDYNVKIDKKLGILIFQPIRFVKIRLLLSQITDNSILFYYAAGILEGTGCWEIHNLGYNKTNLLYTVKLYSKWKLVQFLLKTRIFKWKHSRDIMGLMKKI